MAQIWPEQGQAIFTSKFPLHKARTCPFSCELANCLPYEESPNNLLTLPDLSFSIWQPAFYFLSFPFCFTENISQHGNKLSVYFLPLQKQSRGLSAFTGRRPVQKKAFRKYESHMGKSRMSTFTTLVVNIIQKALPRIIRQEEKKVEDTESGDWPVKLSLQTTCSCADKILKIASKNYQNQLANTVK